MDSGVAQAPVDLAEYREQLERRLGKANEVMRVTIHKAQRQPKRVVFPEGEEPKILRACQILLDERIASPILLGNETRTRAGMATFRLQQDGIWIIDPEAFDRLPACAEQLYVLR
jgi:malate dehydrogenase (oxaloacetate-decarboxylating)(NADP+)